MKGGLVTPSKFLPSHSSFESIRKQATELVRRFATGSFGDSGDPHREQMFTRLECAEFLLDAGAILNPAIWEDAIRARAKGVLQLLSRKGVLPRNLDTLTALGDYDGVRDCLDASRARPSNDAAAVTQAFLWACRFDHRAVAALLLDRCIELDPALGLRVEKWRGRSGFIDSLVEHPQTYGGPWQTVVMTELLKAIDEDNLQA